MRSHSLYHDTVAVKSVDKLKLTAVFEPGEDGWINVHVLEIPGINTCGRGEAEAREMLADAVREFVASLADEADPAAARYETIEFDLG